MINQHVPLSMPTEGPGVPQEAFRHPNPTKEWLKRAGRLDACVEALLDRKQRYIDMASRATGTYTATRVSGMSTRSKVEDGVCGLIDLEREIDAQIDEFVDTTREIERAISAVTDARYRDLLSWRYLNGWTWERIAEGLGYELRWTYEMHGQALLEVKKHIQTTL